MASDISFNGQGVIQILTPIGRILAWLTLGIYLFAALGVLSVRYVLLPNIKHYQPFIERQLSQSLGVKLSFDSIQAKWQGLNPHIRFSGLVIHDAIAGNHIRVPTASAIVSWRTLMTGVPQFKRVQAQGIDAVWASSGGPDQDVPALPLAHNLVSWLAAQPELSIGLSRLSWDNPNYWQQPLQLHDIWLKARNQNNRHALSLEMASQNPAGARIDLRAHLLSSDPDDAVQLDKLEGQLYLNIKGFQPEAWRNWFPALQSFSAAELQGQVWADIKHGQMQSVISDVKLRSAFWKQAELAGIRAESAQVFLQTSHTAIKQWLNYWSNIKEESKPYSFYLPEQTEPTTLQWQVKEVEFDLPAMFAHKLKLDHIAGKAGLNLGETGPIADVSQIVLANNDFQLTGKAKWQGKAQKPGQVDITASLPFLRLSAVHKYMPLEIDEEARDWLRQGLLGGHVYDGQLVLKGDLLDFPFDGPESEGEFRLLGQYKKGVMDYLPPTVDEAGWPWLSDIKGSVEIAGIGLKVLANKANLELPDQDVIQIEGVVAEIADLRDTSILKIQANSTSAAESYLTLMRISPLGAMLEHAFDTTQAKGRWQVPLNLTIPLQKPVNTQVEGQVHMQTTQVQFDPSLPEFTALNGSFSFSELGAQNVNVKGRFLGEAIHIQGGVGKSESGLKMSGILGINALKAWIAPEAQNRFAGKLAYSAHLYGIGPGSDNVLALDIQSNLKGLALHFPMPINKQEDQSWPIQIHWRQSMKSVARDLTIQWKKTSQSPLLHAQFQRLPVGKKQAASQTYFQSALIHLGDQKTVSIEQDTSQKGMRILIDTPVFNADSWSQVLKTFFPQEEAEQTLFPELQQLSLKATHARMLGLDLDEFDYQANLASSGHWKAQLQSQETIGELSWKESKGAIEGAVQAVFKQLALGHLQHDETVEAALDTHIPENMISDDFALPSFNLKADKLKYYGHPMGQLTLIGLAKQAHWQLEKVVLSSPAMHLEGQGHWQLKGKNRGLNLTAQADISDLGNYLNQLGFTDLLSEGAGKLDISLQWPNFPWSEEIKHLKGQFNVEIEKGRLSTLESYSGRLLELLSLQSIKRLQSLELNPLSLTKNGFPYDIIKGEIHLNEGFFKTNDYRIAGPVATIVLDGEVAVPGQELSLNALVIPNLDVSGAAIAAGIAINPVVGIGAFLTQWLLKTPLSKAMAVQYRITGDLKEPKVEAVKSIGG